MCHSTPVETRGQLQDLNLSCHFDLWDQSQAVTLGRMWLYLLSHLAVPKLLAKSCV